MKPFIECRTTTVQIEAQAGSGRRNTVFAEWSGRITTEPTPHKDTIGISVVVHGSGDRVGRTKVDLVRADAVELARRLIVHFKMEPEEYL